MGPRCLLPVVSVLLLQVVGSFVAALVHFFPVGGELNFDVRPSAPSGTFTDLVWKFNENLVVEWSNGQSGLEYYGPYKTRASLDVKTGRLRIVGLQVADSGTYTVDINNQVSVTQFQVQVILKLLKVKIWVSPLVCSHESKNCSLGCGLDQDQDQDQDLGNFGPLTHTWKVNSGPEWLEAGPKMMVINNDTTRQVPEFQCQIKNPVSKNTSEAISNPFFRSEPDSNNTGKIVGGVIGVILVILIVGGLVWWKCNICQPIRQNHGTKQEEDEMGHNQLLKKTDHKPPQDKTVSLPSESVDPHEDTVAKPQDNGGEGS